MQVLGLMQVANRGISVAAGQGLMHHEQRGGPYALVYGALSYWCVGPYSTRNADEQQGGPQSSSVWGLKLLRTALVLRQAKALCSICRSCFRERFSRQVLCRSFS